jgi:hypothetical protein
MKTRIAVIIAGIAVASAFVVMAVFEAAEKLVG